MELFNVFFSAVLPVVAIMSFGFVLDRVQGVDPGPLNAVTLYILAPALVFHSLAITTLSGGEILRVAVGVFVFSVLMMIAGEATGRLAGDPDPMIGALILVAVFSNSGNLGIPIADFAFGELGRQTAALYMSVQSVVMYTLGVYMASRSGGVPGVTGLQRVFQIPLVYAVGAALVGRQADLIPSADAASMSAIGLLADAAIPVMLLILGIQLSRTDYHSALSSTLLGTTLRLGVAPLVGVFVAFLVGFENVTVARVFILECAMPVAVTPVILVIEFTKGDAIGGVTVPEFISASILVTTLLSIPLLTALIAVLQSGVII